MPDASRGGDPARIRDEIERRLGSDPAITLIDIGAVGDGLTIRVHVRSPEDATRLRDAGLPASVEGFPVTLVVADYGLEGRPG